MEAAKGLAIAASQTELAGAGGQPNYIGIGLLVAGIALLMIAASMRPKRSSAETQPKGPVKPPGAV